MTNKKIKHLQDKLYEIDLIIEKLRDMNKIKKNISTEKEIILIHSLLSNLKYSLRISNELYSSLPFLFFRTTKCKNNIAQDFRVGVRFNIIDSINKIEHYKTVRINTVLSMLKNNIKSAEKTLEKFI